MLKPAMRRSENPARGFLSVAEAEAKYGIADSAVSRWRISLKHPDKYRERIMRGSMRAAGLIDERLPPRNLGRRNEVQDAVASNLPRSREICSVFQFGKRLPNWREISGSQDFPLPGHRQQDFSVGVRPHSLGAPRVNDNPRSAADASEVVALPSQSQRRG
jgi:hypothetical protein